MGESEGEFVCEKVRGIVCVCVCKCVRMQLSTSTSQHTDECALSHKCDGCDYMVTAINGRRCECECTGPSNMREGAVGWWPVHDRERVSWRQTCLSGEWMRGDTWRARVRMRAAEAFGVM